MDESNELDDIQRIKPLRCPRCGRPVIFKADDHMVCNECGELYYDQWLGIYRIKPYVEET